MANESTKWLYDQLKGKGYNVGKDLEEFDSLMRSNADSRKWAYETATKSGLNVGKDIDEFSTLVGGGAEAPGQDQIVSAGESTPGDKPWLPTPLWQVRNDVDAVMGDFNRGTTASLDRARRVAERVTPEGQRKLKRAETHARLNGLPTRAAGITPGAAAGSEGQTDTSDKPADARMLSGQGPVPYGVKMVDGEPLTQWLLPDGSLTTDIMEADKAEYGARNVRLMNEFTGRMKKNGLDPANQDDVETQRQKDSMSNMTVSSRLRQAMREQERLDELMRRRREEIEAEGKARPGLSFLRGMADESHGMAGGLVNDNGMKDYRLDDEYRQLESAARKNRQTIQTLTDRQNDRMDSFWHSLGTTFTNGYTLTDGMAEMNDAIALMSAKKHVPEINRKRKSGEALTRDEEAAEAVLSNTLIDDEVQGTIGQEYGAWARAGSMFSMSLDLMKDIMLTPGAGTIAKGIASGVSKGLGRGVSKAVARVAGEKAAEKAAENLATRFLTKATGVLIGAHAAGAVISNTAGIGHTLGETWTGVAGKVTQDGNGYAFTDEKGMLEALYDAERNQTRENGSEMFGEFIPGIGGLVTKGLERIGLKRISEQLTKIGSKDWYRQYSSLLESGGYNGLPGEAIEEYEGYLFDILTGHGEEAMKELADKNTHIDIWLGCATTGALLGAVPMVMHGGHTAMYYRYKHAAGKSDGVASAVIGDRWDGIRDRIDGSPNEQLADVLIDVLANENLGERETTAMMDYVRNLAKMRGYNLAQIASVEDGQEMNPEEADAEESFRDGYSATTPQEMNDARLLMERTRQKLVNNMSEDYVAEYFDGEDAVGNLLRLEDDPELRRNACDYVNAREVYRGMIQRVRDDVDARIAQSDAMIDSRVNRETGMIQPATMKIDDRPVYIVNGNVAMYEDGTGVDTENSSESIIIRDAETGKIEFADPAQVLNVGEVMDATAEKEAARIRITQEMAQAAADNIDGKLSFAPGESYSVLDSEGNDITVTVLGQTIDENGQPVDGSVDVQYPDGSIQPVPKADMQRQADAANERRVAQFDEERSADETGETLPENEPYNAVGAAVAGEWLTGSGENAISSADYLVKALSGLFPMASEAIERIRVENQDSLNVFIDDFLADASLWNKVTGAIRDKVMDVYGAGEAVDILDELLRYPKGAPYRIGQELSARLDRLNASAGQSGAEAPAHDRIIGHEEENQPALSRIPVDEKGDPIYEQAEPDLAWDGLLEESRGNEKIARSVIAQEIAEREDALKKLEKQKPKAGLSTKEKIAAELARQDQMDAIQRSIDHWKRMGETVQRRQAEADRLAAEEARRRADERRAQEEQARAEREEAERKEREALNGVPDWSHDTPQDARARGYRRFGPEKVDRQEPVASVVGKDIEVKFGESELPKGKAALIDISALQPSHIDGMRNPRHFLDEAQPKERTDAPSREAARKIASNIRPEEITSSVTAYTGAPTVNSRGETIQGNSRSDALRTMYESYPEQAAKYRQYLIDHAADFGLTPEQVEGMEKPVLVNMLDVADDEAIRLGQFVAQDTESGGIERIKPKNAVKKMGAKIRNFANILLRTSDDEASLSQLVDSNGVDVLKWMAQQGFINDTQYASAFDSKGNLTGEAANDLKGILYQSIFTGGSTRLEEMFNQLPSKAQRAILATAFRDYDSSRADRMVEEIQQSIIAYNDMMQYEAFASATNIKDATGAMESWKRQYAMDDVTGEPYLPAEKFSNFALALAAIYKGGSQRFIQQTFNDLYDTVQGTAQDTLFEEADKTPKPLAEAIRKVLDIEYQPINKNDNGDNGGNAVDIDTPQGEARRSGSDGNAGGGERSQDGGRTADSGRGAEADSRDREDVVGRSLTREEATHLISRMESNAGIAPIIDLTPENWIEQFGEDGKVETPVGTVKMGENQFMKLFSRKRAEYFGMIKPTLTNPDVIIEKTAPADGAERDTKLLFIKTFIKPDGSRIVHFESVTVQRDGMEVSISSHEAKAKDIKKDMQKEKILHISDKLPLSSEWSLTEAPDIPEGPDLVPTSDNDISDGKDNTLSSEKQGNEEKSSLGERISEAEHDQDGGLPEGASRRAEAAGLNGGAEAPAQDQIFSPEGPRPGTGGATRHGDGADFSGGLTGIVGSEERDENGRPFVLTDEGFSSFGYIDEESGLTPAPIKLSEGFQDETTGQGYGLLHIEAGHGNQIRAAGFRSVKDFVSFVAKNYDRDNIRVGKRRPNGNGTFLIQVTDKHDNTLFIELSNDGSYWNVNSGGIFRKGYSNKKETVAKTEPQQPNNAVSGDSSLSADEQSGISSAEPNGESSVSEGKGNALSSEKQETGGKSSLGERISEAEARVNTEPTEAQKEAGNYRMGHVQVGSFDVTIENPKGSKRSGTDADGTRWETTITHTYGYIRGTKGVDGDHIDVYISSEVDDWNGRNAFVVDQYNPDGSFDEHKVMLGFNDRDEAYAAYLSNYESGWEKGRRLDITAVPIDEFEKWIESSKRKTKPFADYKSVKDRVDTISSVDKQSDSQGNPIDERGNLIIEDVKSTDEISDEDFSNPTRTIGLPQLPRTVSDAIGAGGRKPIIKKNIFAKNRDSHKDLTPEDGRKILREVLYNPKLYGQNQKETRPYNWILVHLAEKNSSVILEVNPTKDHLEIVNWHYLNGRQLEQKKRQAEREGGRILTLQESNAAGDTSQGLSSEGKGSDLSAEKQGEGAIWTENPFLSETEYIDHEVEKAYSSRSDANVSREEWEDTEDYIEAFNAASDGYGDYIKELGDKGILQRLYDAANVGQRIKMRKGIVDAAGFALEDYVDTSKEKEENRLRREAKNKLKQEERRKKLGEIFHTGDSRAEARGRDKKPSGETRSMAVYDAARGLVEAAGIEDISGAEAPAQDQAEEISPILYDNQGNPMDRNGNLIIEDVKSIDEITDDDFTNPTRTIGLPTLPQMVQQVLTTNGKRVIIKKNIFERNALRHKELTPDMSRAILNAALYNPTLYGKNKPLSRPNNWIVINVPDGKGNNKLVVIEVNENKDNVEIVHWHEADKRGLEKIKRQAEREDGQLLILPSEETEEAGALSGPTFDSPKELSPGSEVRLTGTPKEPEGPDLVPTSDNYVSEGKGNALLSDKQGKGAESSDGYTITPTTYTRKKGKGGETPADKPADAESEDAGAEEWLNENGDKKRRRIINDRISGAYRAFQEADKAYSDLDSELLFGRKATDEVMDERERLHQEYRKRLDEYADSLIDMTDAEAEEAATDDRLAEDVRNRSMKYEYRDETLRKFVAVRNRLEGIRSARLGADAYRKAKDLQEAGAGKKSSKFRIIEASDRRKNANTDYEGVSHIGADRVAMATNGRVLVVSMKDYDPSRADRRVDSRGNDLGVASGLQYRRVINRKVDIVAFKSIRAEESARMTATLKGLQAKERAGRRIVVAFGRGIYRTYDASEWDVFLRSALHLGAKEIEIYSDGVARAQGKDGVAVVLSLPNEGEADLRMDMSRGVSLHVGPDGSHPKKGQAVYEAAKGLVEAAGIEVVEVDDAAAQAMLNGHEKTPVAGQPNRVNEKPTSGSVLLSISGNSSSNRAASKEADEKTPVAGQPNRANEKPTSGSVLAAHSGGSSSNATDSRKLNAKVANDTQSTKNKIKKFKNGDYNGDYSTVDKAISSIASLLAMRNKGGSRYAVLETDGGRTVAVRLADHGANGNNFRQDGADRNLSVVIERRKFDTPDSEIEFTEATIPEATFMERPHEAVAAIVRGVEDVLADREFTLDSSLGTVEKKGIRPRGLKDGEGRVYGWTAGGKVFLNRDAMNPETPVHEYTHLWDEMVMRENPELWERGKELMKRTPVWDEVIGDPNYADIRDDEDAVASEVHSRLTGARGAEILEGMIDSAEKNGAMATAEAVTLVGRIKAWLADMFRALRSTLGKWSGRELADLTAEDFAGLTLRDLAEGMDPRTEMRRGRVARDVTEANPMLGEPDGKRQDEGLSDTQSDTLMASMKSRAERAPVVEITDAGWRSEVTTPLGIVKMGENLREKLSARGRENQYGMLLETLGNPDIVLEERDRSEDPSHERPSSYLFIKTFLKEDGSKYVHFENVTVSQEGMEVSVSSHIIRENQLRKKLKSDRLLYKATALDESANPSAEQPAKGAGSLSSEVIRKPSDSQRTTNTVESERIGLNLESVAKIVENFENPPLPEEKILDREGDVDAGLPSGKDPWMLPWGESMRQDRRRKEEAGRLREAMRGRVTALAEALGVEIDIIEDGSEDHLAANRLTPAKRRAKGWYDTATGKITVVVGNHRTVEDVEATVLHEAVAHYGLRELMGGRFDRFLDAVYEHASDAVKERIDGLAIRNGWNRRTGTEEYLASLAEGADFEKMDRGWWSRIKGLFMGLLRRCGFSRRMRLGDNELRDILWMSWKNLRKPGALDSYLGLAERVAMEHELGLLERSGAEAPAQGQIDNGAHPETNPEGSQAETGGVLFRDGDFTPRDRVLARDWYEKMLGRGSWQFREAVQDSMLGLKTLYEAILTEGGKRKDFRIEDVAGYENAYLYENRMSPTNNSEQHQYFIQHMKPLLNSVHALCGSDERQRRMLTDYMMAKHGLERNAYMRNEAAAAGENTDRDFAGLCGLTGETDWAAAEAAAQKMVDDYERVHDTTELWDNVKRATTATLEKIYLSGMISEDTFNKVLGMYDHYIPLRGWDETTSDEVYDYLTNRNAPFQRSVFKAAKGRGSKADDPIAFIAQMADDAIRQGNRNIMKQRFLNFVHGNPSDLVSVTELWLQYNDAKDEWEPVFADLKPDMTPAEVESELAKFEAKMEQLKLLHPDKYKRGRDAGNIHYLVKKENLREHQVLVKRNGHTYVMTINGNPRAAQALNGLTNPDTDAKGVQGALASLGTQINRELSALYTTRSPDFVVSNMLRDIAYANTQVWVKEDKRYALQFHKNCARFTPLSPRRSAGFERGVNIQGPGLRGDRLYSIGMLLRKWESGTLDETDKYEKMFKEFMLNGGETGYTTVKDIERHKRTIAKELKKRGNMGREAWAELGMQIDLVNRSVENCARFAAYVTSREMGRTIDRSIYDAKEITVNFNKKGSGGKFFDAKGQTLLGKVGAGISWAGRGGFAFWNAGVQAVTNYLRGYKRSTPKAIAATATLMGLGFGIHLLNHAISSLLGWLFGGDDDDDKDEYYDLPEYVRRSNICFKAGNQWITIPLPIEYRAPYGLGELLYGVISGNERYSSEELGYYMAAQVSQLMPIDMLEGINPASPDGFDWESILHPFIPTIAKPLVEVYKNKSWTGLPIYNDAFNEKKPEWQRVYQSTDQHLVKLSRWLNELGGGNDHRKAKIAILDINPAKVEYLLKGYLGGAFTTFMNVKKGFIETPFGDREFEWRNMPLANRVVKSGDERTANRKLQNEYYKYKKEAEDTEFEYKEFMKDEDKGILGAAEQVDFIYNSEEFLRYQIFDSFEPDINAIRDEIKAQTDPDAKKELQAELYATMRELVDALHNPKEYLKSIGASK